MLMLIQNYVHLAAQEEHFNTSHVNVNLLLLLLLHLSVLDFNTSHVNVNPKIKIKY